MLEQVVFAQEADAEVTAAYRWYQDQAPGLGEDFLRCLSACVQSIRRNPAMYRVAVDSFRRAPLRRFPFEVFYETADTALVIYSVFHCSQDPERWRLRLPRR